MEGIHGRLVNKRLYIDNTNEDAFPKVEGISFKKIRHRHKTIDFKFLFNRINVFIKKMRGWEHVTIKNDVNGQMKICVIDIKHLAKLLNVSPKEAKKELNKKELNDQEANNFDTLCFNHKNDTRNFLNNHYLKKLQKFDKKMHEDIRMCYAKIKGTSPDKAEQFYDNLRNLSFTELKDVCDWANNHTENFDLADHAHLIVDFVILRKDWAFEITAMESHKDVKIDYKKDVEFDFQQSQELNKDFLTYAGGPFPEDLHQE